MDGWTGLYAMKWDRQKEESEEGKRESKKGERKREENKASKRLPTRPALAQPRLQPASSARLTEGPKCNTNRKGPSGIRMQTPTRGFDSIASTRRKPNSISRPPSDSGVAAYSFGYIKKAPHTYPISYIWYPKLLYRRTSEESPSVREKKRRK